jgi:4-amino-4-deoxy-L-arabinose transferase-like glycosyltransferase
MRLNFKSKELYLFCGVILIALGLRLWKIDQYMNFLGDEGRDALIVSKIITEGNLPFIGPPTSVGDMYLGPLYYYMMTIPMFLSGLNPVSAAVMVAIIGTATVGLIYLLARKWFGSAGASVAAFLYAISPVAIVYSKSSWNPNPVPFFTLIIFGSLYLAHKSKNYLWFIITGIGMAAVLQMHYLSLILLPIIGSIWFIELILSINKSQLHNFWKGTLIGGGMFLIIMLPLILFDFKHDFLNFHAFEAILLGKNETVAQTGLFGKIWPIYQEKLIGRYMVGGNWWLSLIVAVGLLLPIIFGVYQKISKKRDFWVIGLLALWLFLGLIGAAFYRGEIYDHYLGFLSPLPYLLLAALVAIINYSRLKIFCAIGIVAVLGYFNIVNNPLRFEPNRQLQRSQDVAAFVVSEAGGTDFNFALLSKNNYDAAYQFFLKDSPNVKQLPDMKTNVLFVVCEDVICDPVGNSKFEIAAFGWTQIEWERDLSGVKVFKLVPNPDQPKSIK